MKFQIWAPLALLVLLASCNQQKLQPSGLNGLSKQLSFEKVFDCVDTLSFPPSAVIGEVSKMVACHNSRYVLADNVSRKFYFFNADGKADWQFGRYGEGEGEFSDISDFSFSKDGYLFILDAILKRVTVLKDTAIVRTFAFNLGTSIWAEDTSHIYVYDASVVNDMENIFHYDWNGNLIGKFGRPSKATLLTRIPVSKGSVILDEKKLYTLSATDYEIKRYEQTGEYVKSFAHLPDFYVSVSEIFKDSPSREKLQKLTVSYPMLLANISGIKTIIVQVTHSGKGYLHLYDLEGKFIWGVKMPDSTYCVGANDGFIYLLREEQSEKESPKVLIYAASQNRRL
ncbi:MAG: 6-bladed beta-propeller [Chloroherpetonaceae bacterium]|nr:6-bladed beta-propeller [Chloroherpetonaceae bacterium]